MFVYEGHRVKVRGHKKPVSVLQALQFQVGESWHWLSSVHSVVYITVQWDGGVDLR